MQAWAIGLKVPGCAPFLLLRLQSSSAPPRLSPWKLFTLHAQSWRFLSLYYFKLA
jgi:hypothetical protein